MIGHGPAPTVTIVEALLSEDKRRERDEQLAAWCGLAEDEVAPFLRRLALYDLREEARQEEEAVRRLEAARKRRVELESRGDLERLRDGRVRRRQAA